MKTIDNQNTTRRIDSILKRDPPFAFDTERTRKLHNFPLSLNEKISRKLTVSSPIEFKPA